jgi:hypothetical protein
MRYRFVWGTVEEVFGFGVRKKIVMIQLLYVFVGTELLNLCFGDVFRMTRKGYVISGKKEKKQAKIQIDKINAELESELRQNWELETGMRRMGLRGKGGPKPQFRMTKENGVVVREKGKGGIDWWRYQQVILKSKLIPFAFECIKDRPNTVG